MKSILWSFRPCAVGLVTAAVACSNITSVENPAVLQPPDLITPTGAASLRAGALNTLYNSFSNQSFFTGLFGDEFTLPSSGTGFATAEDQRRLSVSNPGSFPFSGFSAGRISAIEAISTLQQVSPQPTWHIGELYAVIAATELEFAEDLCSGVPMATVSGFTPSYGPTLSTHQLLVTALTDLDSAAKYSTGSDSIADLVAVLRGRAYSDSGDLADALTAVGNVPVSFAYTAELSDTTNINEIYNVIVLNGQATVSDREGINGLPFISAGDPRVPVVALQVSGNNVSAPANDLNGSAPLILASGVEAQLIAAEAELAAGQTSNWAAILNNLRENAIAPAMADLTADSTTTASASMQVAVMFRERAFWLFATGHRLGDLRRLVRQYGLSANSVYPTGAYFGGPSTYGESVVYPVAEQNDPNYHGCLNQNP
jgi:starch-binding outer membrane protein, SusD/RagB family